MGFDAGSGAAAGAAAGTAIFPGVGSAVGAGVGLIAGLISQGINNHNVDATNAANRAFALEQQDRQNAYNMSMWNLQNEYNSPTAAMARFKAAGLNPNLIYGAGASGATFASAPTPSARAEYVQQAHPAFDGAGLVSSSIRNFNDIKLANAQASNLDAQADVNKLDAMLKAASMGSNISLAQNSADAKAAEVGKLNADTTAVLDANERANALQQPNMALALQEVINSRAKNRLTVAEASRVVQETQNLIQQNHLNDIELNFKSHGINPNENTVTRMLGLMIDAVFRKAGVDGVLLPYSGH